MCIFCDIKEVNKDVPGNIIFEDETVIAFHNIYPLAPVHVLVIPKKHIATVNDLQDDEEGLVGHMILIAKKIAKDLQISEKGYKLIFRVGEWGGQEVEHLHLHILGGAKLQEDIRIAV